MNITEHDLVCLQEEAKEVMEEAFRIMTRCSKALRFGMQEVQPGQLLSNADRLRIELGDLYVWASALIERGDISAFDLANKEAKIERFKTLSRLCGVLQDEKGGVP